VIRGVSGQFEDEQAAVGAGCVSGIVQAETGADDAPILGEDPLDLAGMLGSL